MKYIKILFTFLMLLTMLAVTASGFAAEQNTEDATYVIVLDAQKPYLYPCPHRNILVEDLDFNGSYEKEWTKSKYKVFNIHNITDDETEKQTYASYCLDDNIDAVPGHSYRIENLKDSKKFKGDTPDRLRAMLMNSYPRLSVSQVQTAVNEWIEVAGRSNELENVENLTETECIMATQSALWSLVNSYLKVGVHYNETTLNPYGPNSASLCVYPNFLKQTKSNYTSGNCEAIYEYLRDLDGVPPVDPVIGDYTIQGASAVLMPQNNNKYTATITVELSHIPKAGDITLTVKEKNTDNSVSLKLEGQSSYTLTLADVASKTSSFDITLTGVQEVEDVFLFVPKGGPNASQTMGGFMKTRTNIYSEYTLEKGVVATPSPKPTATPDPTATPTTVPTATPDPTATPTTVPTATPDPTATPTTVPTATPDPTATPTTVPTATPDPDPTATPSPTPDPQGRPGPVFPTETPSVTPIATPNVTPTMAPTIAPTATPTATPTVVPTVAPTATPSTVPTAIPTAVPTTIPTATPAPDLDLPETGDEAHITLYLSLCLISVACLVGLRIKRSRV